MAYTKSRGVKAHEADFFSGKEILDAEEEEFLEMQALERAKSKGMKKFYNRYIAWLF